MYEKAARLRDEAERTTDPTHRGDLEAEADALLDMAEEDEAHEEMEDLISDVEESDLDDITIDFEPDFELEQDLEREEERYRD